MQAKIRTSTNCELADDGFLYVSDNKVLNLYGLLHTQVLHETVRTKRPVPIPMSLTDIPGLTVMRVFHGHCRWAVHDGNNHCVLQFGVRSKNIIDDFIDSLL